MAKRPFISVDRRECDGALQIAIAIEDDDGSSHGYRIAGPKYDGRGKTLLKHYISERDVSEIRSYLASGTKPKLIYNKTKRTIVPVAESGG